MLFHLFVVFNAKKMVALIKEIILTSISTETLKHFILDRLEMSKSCSDSISCIIGLSGIIYNIHSFDSKE